MTRETLELWVRKIWEESLKVDAVHTIDVTKTVTGAEVFCWHLLSCRQLQALSRGLFTTARLTG